MAAFGPTATYPTATIPYRLTFAYTLASAVAAFVLTAHTTIRALVAPVAVATFVLTAYTTIRAIGFAVAVGAFTLTGRVTTRVLIGVVAGATFVFTGFGVNEGIVFIVAVAAFTLTGMANILTHWVKPASQLKHRLAPAILYQTRKFTQLLGL